MRSPNGAHDAATWCVRNDWPPIARYAAAMRLAAITLLLTTAAAQTPREHDLLSEDWRERNRAATALAEADWRDLRLGELLKVVDTPMDESPAGDQWNSAVGLGGGYGGRYGSRRRPDPRAEVLSTATTIAGVNTPPRDSGWPAYRITGAHDLIVPWSPCELATWLVELHVARGANWATTLVKLPPRTPHLARCWWLGQPDGEAVQRELGHAEHGAVVADLLDREDERGWPHFRDALRGEDRRAHRRVAEVADAEVFDTLEMILAIVEDYVDEDDDAYRHAGSQVYRRGDRAIVALLEHADGSEQRRRRTLAMLTCLREHAELAVPLLVANVGADEFSTPQALVALADCDIPDDQRAAVAAAAMAVFRESERDTVRALACDVLGRCGEGVDDDMRDELRAALQKEPGFFSSYSDDTPRLLACLHRLGAVPEMPAKTRRSIAQMDWATADTWMAFAADGREVAAPLVRELLQLPGYELLDAVAARAVELDPELVARAVRQPPNWRHARLMTALLEEAPEAIPEEELLAMALADDARSGPATLWLAEHTGEKYAKQILAVAAERSWLGNPAKMLIVELEASPEELFELLAPQLRRGQEWDLVAAVDVETRRARCLQWLDEAEDDRARDSLLATLITFGPMDEDVGRIRAAIEEGRDVLDSLLYARRLPEQLRAHLDGMLDDATLDVGDLQTARRVLLAHARS